MIKPRFPKSRGFLFSGYYMQSKQIVLQSIAEAKV